MTNPIISVAVPTPLRRTFDYLAPASGATVPVGARVRVPFGRRSVIGVVVGHKRETDIDPQKLRRAEALLDGEPLIGGALMELCRWAARYYHHALGEVLQLALPVSLRTGKTATSGRVRALKLTTAGRGVSSGALKRAPRQQALLYRLLNADEPINIATLRHDGFDSAVIGALVDKGLAERCRLDPLTPTAPTARPPTLNAEQATAVEAIESHPDGFGVFLLEGVTGSGKTEVYLRAIADVVTAGRQALVLVPEIGLTPQTIARFRARIDAPVLALHSGLNDSERMHTWTAARDGRAAVVIGTRSALLTPFNSLGLIVVDEEHDLSYKQQEGLRYSARDLAVVRGQLEQVAVILGSATPSLESLHNAHRGQYRHLLLPRRAGVAAMARAEIIDLRNRALTEGFSDELLGAIGTELAGGNQVLIFLNRRGFAPSLICHSCGWAAECPACDAKMTLHRHPSRLQCHHCERLRPLPPTCPQCGSHQLLAVGHGTERTEAALAERFAGTPVLRIDRDNTQRKGSLEALLDEVNAGRPCILVGTQMLAKGHHFPNVTLVGVLDADAGFASADFRGAERTGQLLLQVAGRAGRERRPGRVLIQTHMPEHPLLTTLLEHGYGAFAEAIARERATHSLPPYSHLALIAAEAADAAAAETLLTQLRSAIAHPGINITGPLPAPLGRRGGNYRYQLMLKAIDRAPLHTVLDIACEWLEQAPPARRCRWHLDVDPQDLL